MEEYITQKLDCEVDSKISDISNYDIEKYEKWHLGSQGQRTGQYYAGIDDFDLFIPKFDTTIQHNDQVGKMQDLVYNMEKLQKRELNQRGTYDYVFGNSLSDYKNLDCKNDKKILIMTDSMGECVNQYLIMGFGEIKTLSDYTSEDLTAEVIQEYNPDIVILLYYPIFLQENSVGFNFSF